MDLVYLIRSGCIEKMDSRDTMQVVNTSNEGTLLSVNNDQSFVNEALNEGCTVYARYYRFRIIRMGNMDALKNAVRPLDLWVENNVLNLVVNPLRLSVLDIARALYSFGFDVELLSETDVEFME
ncbi:MAG: hypothetical protein L7G99_04830 [Vulcanisaeta sp.]|nr:hypothetical protein [Vulcanisaeta sp.]